MEVEPNHRHLRPRHGVLCNRHVSCSVSGFCAICLQERLSGMDPQIAASRQLGRSKSLSVFNRAFSSSAVVEESHRRSCDARSRSTLSDLLIADNGRKKCSSSHRKFKGLGFDLGIEINEIEVIEGDDKNRDLECKTMKQLIDLEWGKNSRNRNTSHYSNVTKNFREVASSFTRRITKWQSKIKTKHSLNSKEKSNPIDERTNIFGLRRSCDVNPRFSLDSAPHRASWDGCLVDNGRRHSYPNDNAPPFHITGRSKLKDDEMKAKWNVKVSSNAVELLNARKLVVTEKELRDSNWYTSSNEPVQATPIRETPTNTKWWHKILKGNEESGDLESRFFRFYLTPLRTQSGRSKNM